MAVRQNIETISLNGEIRPIRIIRVPIEDGSYARYKFRCYVQDFIPNAEFIKDTTRIGFHYSLPDGRIVRLR